MDESYTFISDRLTGYDSAFNAYISKDSLNKVGIKENSIIEILHSGNSFLAVAKLSLNLPIDFIQLSRVSRVNLRCYLGENVNVKLVQDCQVAESVLMAPISDTIKPIKGPYNKLLELNKISLIEAPVKEGLVVPFYVLNRIVEFKVVECCPKAECIIKDINVIKFSENPIERDNSPCFKALSYDDLGGIDKIINGIRKSLELLILQPQLIQDLDIPKSFLLVMPSGMGKTFLSNCLKSESIASLALINCADIAIQKKENAIKKLNNCFKAIISKKPCIAFFDDLDYIIVLSKGNTESKVSNLLFDGIRKLREMKDIIIIATINKLSPDFDYSTKFDKIIQVGYPRYKERLTILKILTRSINIEESILEKIARDTKGQTAANLKTIIRYSLSNSLSKLLKSLRKSILNIDDILSIHIEWTEELRNKYMNKMDEESDSEENINNVESYYNDNHKAMSDPFEKNEINYCEIESSSDTEKNQKRDDVFIQTLDFPQKNHSSNNDKSQSSDYENQKEIQEQNYSLSNSSSESLEENEKNITRTISNYKVMRFMSSESESIQQEKSNPKKKFNIINKTERSNEQHTDKRYLCEDTSIKANKKFESENNFQKMIINLESDSKNITRKINPFNIISKDESSESESNIDIFNHKNIFENKFNEIFKEDSGKLISSSESENIKNQKRINSDTFNKNVKDKSTDSEYETQTNKNSSSSESYTDFESDFKSEKYQERFN